jgi:hypothetical protein
MVVANTLTYCDTATFTAVKKSFIVGTPECTSLSYHRLKDEESDVLNLF